MSSSGFDLGPLLARWMGGAKRYPSIAFCGVMGFAGLNRRIDNKTGSSDLPVGRRCNFPVYPPLQKYFASPVEQIISTNSRHPAPPEGRIAIVTDAGCGCGGRGSVLRATGLQGRLRPVSDQQHADERCCCVRQNRVVLTPRRWCQVRGVASALPGLDKTYPRTTVAKEPGHRGERAINR